MSRKTVNGKLKILRERRKTLQNQEQPDREETKLVHKEFQKELRSDLRAKGKAKINEILSQFSDLKSITKVRANGKRKMMTGMKHSSGEVVRDRQRIADVFADFYESFIRQGGLNTKMGDGRTRSA